MLGANNLAVWQIDRQCSECSVRIETALNTKSRTTAGTIEPQKRKMWKEASEQWTAEQNPHLWAVMQSIEDFLSAVQWLTKAKDLYWPYRTVFIRLAQIGHIMYSPRSDLCQAASALGSGRVAGGLLQRQIKFLLSYGQRKENLEASQSLSFKCIICQISNEGDVLGWLVSTESVICMWWRVIWIVFKIKKC